MAVSHPDLDFHPDTSVADRRWTVERYVAALAALEECRARLDALPKQMRQRDPEKAAVLEEIMHASYRVAAIRGCAPAPPLTPEQVSRVVAILRSVP